MQLRQGHSVAPLGFAPALSWAAWVVLRIPRLATCTHVSGVIRCLTTLQGCGCVSFEPIDADARAIGEAVGAALGGAEEAQWTCAVCTKHGGISADGSGADHNES